MPKTEREDWDFPADRALADTSAGRHQVALNLSVGKGTGTLEIGFAVLLIFSRVLNANKLAVRLLRGTTHEMRIAADFPAEATLGQAFASCKVITVTDEPEIGLVILEHAAQGDGRHLELSVSHGALGPHLSLAFESSRFSLLSARDLLEKIEIVLTALSAKPKIRCADLELITHVARDVLSDFSRPIDAGRPEFAFATFLRIAGQYPSAPAVSNGQQSYSYGQLSRLVRHIAFRLTEAGIQPGDIVALSGFSSLGMFASMLAVMVVGGVFVTVDLALPAERRELIEAMSQPIYRIEVRAPGEMATEDSIITTDWPTPSEINSLPSHPVRVTATGPDAPAYVFFTSGSTGVPKGVLGTHVGLGHFLAWERSNFPVGPGDRVAQLTALSFDPVLRDVLLPLTSGACLEVPQRDLLLDANRILRWFSDSNITLAHCVPSLMKAWLQVNTGAKPFRSLRYILFAGEPLTDSLLKRFREASGPDTRIINLYGPTETTLAKVANVVERPEPGVQPIGYPLPGTDVAIIRDRRTHCGLWEIGEIAIRTPYRSKGYFRNPVLTAEVFVSNPARNDPEDLVYFSGDLGRIRPDGIIEIFGRTDAQIKIRGVRIEPNEVEDRLLGLPGVKDAAVTVRIAANGDKLLFGLIVLQTEFSEIDEPAFGHSAREALRRQLSDPMVPARIVLCETLPYLPNGKLDRKAIAALKFDSQAGALASLRSAADLDDMMRRLVVAIEDALDTRVDRLDKSFVDFGGDSLSYISASIAIERLLGWLPEKWETKPLSQFAQLWAGADAVKGRQHWVSTELVVVIRAVSIILVLMSNTEGLDLLAATSTLFVISGISFNRFVRPPILDTGNLGPTAKLILKFAIPAGLWQVLRSLWMHNWWAPNLFLLGTFFQNPSRPLYTLWYLDVLAANLILMAAISWLGYCMRTFRGTTSSANTFRTDFVWLMIGFAMAAAQVLSGWWDGQVGTDSVAPFKWFWMLVLGVLVAGANSVSRKWLVTGLLAVLAAATYLTPIQIALAAASARGIPPFTPGYVGEFFFVAIALMVWVERIPVPRLLHRPLVVVASATLFIYIVHSSATTILMPKLHLPPWLPLQVAMAIGCGVVCYLVWHRLTRMKSRLVDRSLRTVASNAQTADL